MPRPFVLYVGGYGPNKNLHRLLRAFARLDGATDLRLVVIGWGESQSVVEAKKLVKSLNLGERVHLLANCFSDAELSAFYGGCEAFVYPSLHEGFGLPVLEALAHGVPTACSNSSSLTAVAGEAALYFDPLSESDMANVMRRVLCDERLRCHLGVAARIRAGEFAWAETAASIRRVAETLSATLGRARLEP